MHLENLAPILSIAPLLGVLVVAAGGCWFLSRILSHRQRNAWDQYESRYWAEEMAYRAKIKIKSLFVPNRTPRLPYFPPVEADMDESGTLREIESRQGFTAEKLAARNAGMTPAKDSSRLDKLRFRAWHRGTREADYMLGGYFDRYHETWSDEELRWFEDLLEHDDVEVIAWALNSETPPRRFEGEQLELMRKLDYVRIA